MVLLVTEIPAMILARTLVDVVVIIIVILLASQEFLLHPSPPPQWTEKFQSLLDGGVSLGTLLHSFGLGGGSDDNDNDEDRRRRRRRR